MPANKAYDRFAGIWRAISRQVPASDSARWRERLIPCYWALYPLLLSWTFSRLTLDYYDAFDNLREARRLAGADTGFQALRAPLVALLHAPVQALLDGLQAGPMARLAVPHLFQCLVTCAFLAAAYRYFRLVFSPGWAQLGAVLLSLNRLTVHYFGSVMGEIPAALFFLLFLLLLEKNAALSAAALACGLLCRWNMPILLVGILAGQAALARRSFPRCLGVAASGTLAFVLGCALVYRRLLGVPWAYAPRFLAWVFRSQYTSIQGFPESPWSHVASLHVAAGLPILLFLGVGLWRSLREKDRRHLFHAVVFLFFMGAMSLAISHKESRYLFPILPFFYCTVLLGIGRACSRRPRVRGALAGALLTWAAVGAAREWARFADPVYRDPILFDALRSVEAAANPGARIFWTGSVYSLFPRDPVFTPGDALYYVYGIPSPGSLEYLLGRKVPIMNDELFKTLRDGDVMIRAPRRPFHAGDAWSPEENRLEVVRRSAGSWERVALLPKSG